MGSRRGGDVLIGPRREALACGPRESTAWRDAGSGSGAAGGGGLERMTGGPQVSAIEREEREAAAGLLVGQIGLRAKKRGWWAASAWRVRLRRDDGPHRGGGAGCSD
jgi:hypothetical protein